MSKWVKRDEPNQFFVKEGSNKWVEYQNGSKFADFEELSSNSNGTVILRKNDGTFIKLTNTQAFMGMDKNNINDFICNEFWTNGDVRNPQTRSEQKSQSPVRNDKNERTMEDLYNNALKYIKDTKF